MAILTRRSMLRGSVGLAAGGALARPHVANAAATTAEVWWTLGFAQEEDVAFKKLIADYEKASGKQDRGQHRSIRPAAPEDGLGDHRRRRPGHHGAGRLSVLAAERLGRQARRRQRHRRTDKIAIYR